MDEDKLRYPFPTAPKPSELVEIVPGLLWSRIQLPFRLDHVNVYLIQDDEGWVVVDTGVADSHSRCTWEAIMAHPSIEGRPTRLFVTHHHADHIGLAGWLYDRSDAQLMTSEIAYLTCKNMLLDPNVFNARAYQHFYLEHGMDLKFANQVNENNIEYSALVHSLPPTFVRVSSGDTIRIGKRDFLVLSGEGHAINQLMLYCASERILLAADQVIAEISPHIGVSPIEPVDDPLKLYLQSLEELSTRIPRGTLVLSGHQLPFYGLQERCRQLWAHHISRCELIARACRTGSQSIAQLLPKIFSKPLDDHQQVFAFGEVHAHVNFMLHKDLLIRDSADVYGVRYVVNSEARDRLSAELANQS